LSAHGGEIRACDNDLAAAGTFTVDGLVTDAFVTDYELDVEASKLPT
jgi:protease I